jgi:alkylhydroperoxidase family enzyme
MAHVTLQYQPKGAVQRAAASYSKRRFGKMVEPTAAANNHAGVLVAMGALESAVSKGWNKLDPTLRWLAQEVAASRIGCSWCIDYGYYEGMKDGLDPAKVRAAINWRESDLFSDLERAVCEYTEAATAQPVVVSDELMARLHAHLSDAEIVELAGWVALENFRSRFNGGLGLRSQGFAETCELPPLRPLDEADAKSVG